MTLVTGAVNLDGGVGIRGQITGGDQCIQRLLDQLGQLFLHYEGIYLGL